MPALGNAEVPRGQQSVHCKMTQRVDPETRRAMLMAIFEVAVAGQDNAAGVLLDGPGRITRAAIVEELAAVAEEALQSVLRARAAIMAGRPIDLASLPPAGRA